MCGNVQAIDSVLMQHKLKVLVLAIADTLITSYFFLLSPWHYFKLKPMQQAKISSAQGTMLVAFFRACNTPNTKTKGIPEQYLP